MLDHNSQSEPISGLHVAELAQMAGVTPATVRYYSRIGLLSPQRDAENGYRCFSLADRHRVSFIRRAQSLGLTIGDIKTIFQSIDQGDVPCHQVRELVERRLKSVKKQLEELKATRARITHALSTWEDMRDETPAHGELCPLIDRVDTDDVVTKTRAEKRATRTRHPRSGRRGAAGLAVAHC